MKIEQLYTGCLAQGAYYIVSEKEAVLVDPLRETGPYLDKLRKDGVQLKYILETHFHADFVSGHVDLAAQTGATVVYGPTAQPDFGAYVAADGEEFGIGKIKIKVLHTPGHTMESSCYLLLDENGQQKALFSGDTLFLGDVGRPDLAQKAANMTQEELAGLLYDSLYTKILPLQDDLLVYPGHGAGSACGKNMSNETMDTLGNQKITNYALNQPNKSAFVAAVLEGLTIPPAYFGQNVAMNKRGYETFEVVKQRGLKGLNAFEFENEVHSSFGLVLDTRSPEVFAAGFIPGSIQIGLDGDFAPWVGALIRDVRQPLLLVVEPGREEEAITRLARVGFDQVLGYLEGGFSTWVHSSKEIDTVQQMEPQKMPLFLANNPQTKVVDLRKPSEYQTQHLEGALNRPLDQINLWMGELDPNETFLMHCAGGYRSMMAASILQSRGFRNFHEVRGGFKALSTQTNLPLTELLCSNSSPKPSLTL